MFLLNFLKHILEFLFSLTDSYGLSIILLSLTVTVIMLPLFWIAEKIQNKERARNAKMQPALVKLKDVTNKQEKYYYTRRIYKQYNYTPFYSLTGLLGLFIQIPFFLAAYWMLLEYTPLQGVSFGPIKDLFQADGLLSNGGLSINVLPFVMTIVNLFAGYLYAKNMNKSEQIQLIIIALIFLILLYNLSAALVLYWTMNNVFAIGKNWLISRTNKPVKIDNKIERYSLFGDCVKWLKSHRPQIIFVLFIWSIYFMGLSIFYIINLRICLTTVMSILTYLFFLEIICSLLLIFNNKQKKQLRWTMIIIYLLLNFSLSVFFFLVVFDKLVFISEPLILLLCSVALLLFVIVLLVQNYSMLASEPIDKTKNRNKPYYYFSGILIIISPLIQYYLNNTIYFSIASAFLYFIILLAIPILLIAATNYLNKNNHSIYLLFGAFIALFFTLYTLPIITDITSLIAENNIFVHIISLFTTTCIFIWLYHKSKIAILLFSVILPIGSIVQIIAKPTEGINQTEKNGKQKSDLYNYLSSLEIKRSPNIYYLLYDSYINENLMTFYDIDNSEQMNYLKDKNFHVSENVYSIGATTTISTATLFEVASGDYTSQCQNIILGNSTVDNLLQKNGYETHYIVGEYFLRSLNVPFGGDFLNNVNIESLSENSYSDNSMMTIMYSTLIGEFKFDNEFLQGTITEDIKGELKRHNIANLTSKPKFMFYHTNYPGHGSGNCHPKENERYAKRVQLASNIMKVDVEHILSIDKNAIIIIAGDHGAKRKGDCQTRFKRYKEDEIRAEHILDTYGSFLAVKYPDNYIPEDIIVLQNVFINIFSYLFEVNNLDDYKIPTKTRRRINLPPGCITNGKITFGADKGKSLLEIFSKSSE